MKKFRAWHVKKKCWIDSHDAVISLDGTQIKWEWYYEDYNFRASILKEVVIQQVTGLKDSKKKFIYEGDIIKYVGHNMSYDKPGIISIGEYFTHAKEFYHYGVRVQRLDMENFYFGLSPKESKDYLIIGNIFENPELLKII